MPKTEATLKRKRPRSLAGPRKRRSRAQDEQQSCIVPDCGRPPYARGLCQTHHRQKTTTGKVREIRPYRKRTPGTVTTGSDAPLSSSSASLSETTASFRPSSERRDAALESLANDLGKVTNLAPDERARIALQQLSSAERLRLMAEQVSECSPDDRGAEVANLVRRLAA